tara:strand:- start:2162 stop:2620 length:459 start_codon:yes stop_codon:yes gene_type:complete
MKKKIMIKSTIINNIKDEYVPTPKDFNDWINALEFNTNSELTIKIVTEEEMRNFNILYKKQDKISDTLAFPFDNEGYENINFLGDIAMCAMKINQDSLKYKKEKKERWAHLTIHSVLHILGYKHDNTEDRNIMENLEIDILKKFNIIKPYEI